MQTAHTPGPWGPDDLRAKTPEQLLLISWRQQHERGTDPAPVWGVMQAGGLASWGVKRSAAEKDAERRDTDTHRADVCRVRPTIYLQRTRVEVGTATPRNPRPGYRWAPAYIVRNPWTGSESTPMRRAEAWAEARALGGKHARILPTD